MPWKKVETMDQKIKLIALWQSEENISEIANELGISRKTAYKWINRYQLLGLDGLKEQSRAPRSHPNRTSDEIQERIIEEKIKRPKWGPKKIIKRLQDLDPKEKWPTPSTASYILDKNNLVKPRKKRIRVPPYTKPFMECNAPNDIWSIDYKGQFQTLSKQICYPLTITDNYSRYVFDIKALQGPRYEPTRAAMEAIFKEYGIPKAIRSDNGQPFAGRAVGGLSKLSIWWIKLGIRPERIDLGHPEQNGRHERMHKTLKENTTNPPGFDLREQQKKFDEFLYEFNFERPHEAINMQTPASVYKRSSNEYSDINLAVDYETEFEVRRVRPNGEIKLNGHLYFLSELLPGENIGLKKINDDLYQMFFSFHHLGFINVKKRMLLKYIGKVLPMYPV